MPIEYSRAWLYGRREAALFTKSIKDKYDRVIVSTKIDQPHEFWLYYTKYDPKKYLKDIDISNLKFYKGAGCPHCGNLGYQGRIAVSELVAINQELREIINEGGDTVLAQKVLAKQDFMTLSQDCLIKALKGMTTVDEVMRVSQL